MYVSYLQYRSFELSIRFVHVRVGGKNRYIFNLLQIWSHFIVIAVLVIDEEEDTYNTAFAKSRAPYRTTTEHERFTENYKWLFPSPVSRYCFDNSQRHCVRIWFIGQLTSLLCYCHKSSTSSKLKLPAIQLSHCRFDRHLGMWTLPFGNFLQSNICLRVQTKLGKTVLYFSQSLLLHFSGSFGLY